MNDENNGREVHASTPVETRCTRNDKDQLRQRSGWKMEGIEYELGKMKALG